MENQLKLFIIAAAGFGTILLPQTKEACPKMLPLIDKPIIQYVVEGIGWAGIKGSHHYR